jgi:hypothetical protein
MILANHLIFVSKANPKDNVAFGDLSQAEKHGEGSSGQCEGYAYRAY